MRIRETAQAAGLMMLLLAAPAWSGEDAAAGPAPDAAAATPAAAETPAAEGQDPTAVGTAAPAATAEVRPPSVSWKDGKTTLETESVKIELSNRIQLRFTRDDAGDGVFELRRAKTKLHGWLYTKDLGYGVQLNWADSANPLEDAYLDYDASGRGLFRLTLGQYKVPFGRQELTSSGSQQFVDRSIVSKAFARGRDVGLQVHGALGHGVLEWRAGVFNGNGRSRERDAADAYQWDARLQLAPNGDPKYSEADLESSARPLWAVAFGYQRADLDDAEIDKTIRTTWAADGVFKYRGLSLFGEFFGATDRAPEGRVDDRRPRGFHAQLGQLVSGRRLELALRYGWLDPDSRTEGDARRELGGALSWYFRKHGLKAQADVRRLESDDDDAAETQIRFQAQFVF